MNNLRAFQAFETIQICIEIAGEMVIAKHTHDYR